MTRMIRQLLDVPSADPDNQRRARLLNILLLGIAVLTLLAVLATAAYDITGGVGEPGGTPIYLSSLAMLAGAVTIFAINRYGLGWLASSLFLLLLIALLSLSDKPQEVANGRTLLVFTIPIITASVLLRPYASFIMAGLSSLLIAAIGLRVQIRPNVFAMLAFFATALVSWLAARNLERALQEAQRRAAQAALTYEVGQRVSSELELGELLSAIVTAISAAFGYHSVALGLVDEEAECLTLQAIAGAYADVLPKDLRYPIGTGMTGYAAATGETQISGDVSKDPHFVRMAGEETKSELVIPIKNGQKVIGVLDLQSDELDAFDETDVIVMETLADQVAVAIENARLFEQAQEEIAERKRAEEALQESLEQVAQVKQEWESTADSLPSVVCLLDYRGRIIRANRIVERWNLGRVADVQGRGVHEFLHPGCTDPACYLKTFWYQAWEGLIEGRPTECEAEDGVLKRYLNVQVRPIATQMDEEGKKAASFAVAVVQDITERKRAEEELRALNLELDQRVVERTQELAEALSKNEAILEGIADGVIVFDPYGGAIVANPAIARLLGRPFDEIRGRDIETLMGEDVAAADREVISSLLQDKVKSYPAVKFQWGDKTLSVSFAPIHDDAGTVSGSVAVFRDFTREAEIDRMKSAFISTASHELRTPLNAILGYADMLQEGVYDPPSEKQRSALERIMANTGHLLSLVNNLLDQAQIEAGTLTLDLAPFAPADLVSNVIGALGVLAQAKGLELTSHIADDLPATLFGDQQRLRQILFNLVSNAIKFTDEGTVQIRAYLHNADLWVLEISDTGRGIPPEAHSRIFEPFRHVDSSLTQEYSGAGLGLSIVKQLITLMDGEITLESKVGHGSTFTILLPLVPPEAKEFVLTQEASL